MEPRDALLEYGLSEKETSVYLATLELGSATVNTIAKRARVFRTYCYDILRSLTDEGLVAHIIKKGTAYYEVPNPDILLEKLNRKVELVNNALPELNLLRATAEIKPRTHTFEGRRGVIAIHEDIIKTGKDTIVLGNSSRIVEVLGPYFDRYVAARAKRGIKARVLTEVESKKNAKLIKNSKAELREWRQTHLLNKINTTTYIYGDKVAIITYEKETFGVVIESKAIAETQRIMFEQLWNTTKPTHQSRYDRRNTSIQ